MTKQRMVKMTGGDKTYWPRRFAAHRKSRAELSGQLQPFLDRVLRMPKHKLYLNDEEYQYATLSLNRMRNAYLEENRSCGGD